MCRPIFSVLLLISTLSMGCNRQTKLASHQSYLTKISMGDLTIEEKMDALGFTMTDMINESLSIVNPKKGVDYVKKFSDQNKTAINVILDDLNDHINEMNQIEMIAFGLKLATKDYMKTMVDIVPKFERKYRQYKFALDLSKQLKNRLLNAAGKKILGI